MISNFTPKEVCIGFWLGNRIISSIDFFINYRDDLRELSMLQEREDYWGYASRIVKTNTE
jgi:hypothetical protein